MPHNVAADRKCGTNAPRDDRAGRIVSGDAFGDSVGGDTDTNCAIIGGIVALSASPDSIPQEWLAAREPLQMQSQ
jgi:hypothetical protein